ncbi:Importin alpha subunit (Karyopherin alpha subunit) (Serine-rich RNA polymerase I suppressor protein), partial [Tulasnella sp. 427]
MAAFVDQQIIDGIRSSDRSARLQATANLRRLATRDPDNTSQSIIPSSLLLELVEMLSLDDLELMESSAYSLIEITTGSSFDQISAVAGAGAILRLVTLLSSENETARVLSLNLLGNIGGSCQRLRDDVFNFGGLRLILEILGKSEGYSDQVVDAAAHCLGMCARPVAGQTFSPFAAEQIIPVLAKVIQAQASTTSQRLQDALLTFGRVISTYANVEAAVSAGVVPHLTRLAKSQAWMIQYSALRCIANFTLLNFNAIGPILVAGGLEAYGHALTSPRSEVRHMGCWGAEGVLNSVPNRAASLVESSVIPGLTKAVSNKNEESDIRRHALSVLSILSGRVQDDRGRELLVKAGCMEAFCAALQMTNGFDVIIALQAIVVLVEQG